MTLLRSRGIGHRVSWIPMQGIVHSVHNLLKAFLVLAEWKGWRGEGQKGGYQSHRAQQAELASCQQLQGHTDLPKMGLNFKVHQCVFNRKSACSSSLSVRACSDTAVPSPRSQRVGGRELHLLSDKECFWLRKISGLQSPTPPTATSCFKIQTLNIQRRSQELKLWYIPAFGTTQAGSAVMGHPGVPYPCANAVSWLCQCLIAECLVWNGPS